MSTATYMTPGGMTDGGRAGGETPMLPAVYYTPAPSPPTLMAPPHVELIPHRIFVGGFSNTTMEADLRQFFEKFGTIKEVKIIRNPDGGSKGYAFITFETEQEAEAVRRQVPETFEFNGRRLNVGPAMRKIAQTTRLQDLSVMTPHSPLLMQGGGYTYPGYAVMTAMDGAGSMVPQFLPIVLPQQTPVYTTATQVQTATTQAPLAYSQLNASSALTQQPRMTVTTMISGVNPAGQTSSTLEKGPSITPTKTATISGGSGGEGQTGQGIAQNPTPVVASQAGQPLTPITPGVGQVRWQTLPTTPLHGFSGGSQLYSYPGTGAVQPTYVFTYPQSVDVSAQQYAQQQMLFPTPSSQDPQMTVEVGPEGVRRYDSSLNYRMPPLGDVTPKASKKFPREIKDPVDPVTPDRASELAKTPDSQFGGLGSRPQWSSSGRRSLTFKPSSTPIRGPGSGSNPSPIGTPMTPMRNLVASPDSSPFVTPHGFTSPTVPFKATSCPPKPCNPRAEALRGNGNSRTPLFVEEGRNVGVRSPQKVMSLVPAMNQMNVSPTYSHSPAIISTYSKVTDVKDGSGEGSSLSGRKNGNPTPPHTPIQAPQHLQQ